MQTNGQADAWLRRHTDTSSDVRLMRVVLQTPGGTDGTKRVTPPLIWAVTARPGKFGTGPCVVAKPVTITPVTITPITITKESRST